MNAQQREKIVEGREARKADKKNCHWSINKRLALLVNTEKGA